ncbi:MAG: hypothetical protein R2861_13325 [Desulfobacterales bacterium]
MPDAFSRAWFKLTHRDNWARSRYLGPEVPEEELIWQDPLPVDHALVDEKDVADLKAKVLASEAIRLAAGFYTAWASASTFRGLTCAAGPMARASGWPPERLGRESAGPVEKKSWIFLRGFRKISTMPRPAAESIWRT